MIEQHLSGIKARNGTMLFACSTCKTAPTFTFGAQDNGELVHLMLCPECGIVLGEWSSIEARDDELRSLATSLQLRAKSHSGVKKQRSRRLTPD
jgi:hypothetical protein